MPYPKNRKSRFPPPIERFHAAIWTEPNTGCHLWVNNVDGGGYGKLWFNGREEKAHRFIWIHTNGPILNGLHVLHKCDTPACCNIDHLFLGTPRDNAEDRTRKGRTRTRGMPGISNNANKLTENQVREIRSDPRGPYKTGRDYGVSARTIDAIRKRETWRHI